MRNKLLLIGATLALATATVPAAQASGCYDRPDGTRHCSAAGGYGNFGKHGRGSGRQDGAYQPKSGGRVGVYDRGGDQGYGLSPFGRGQSGITCYNIAGRPYTYKGGGRCPIS